MPTAFAPRWITVPQMAMETPAFTLLGCRIPLRYGLPHFMEKQSTVAALQSPHQ